MQLYHKELLFEHKRWFHRSELAELLNCTERAVKDYIFNFKNYIIATIKEFDFLKLYNNNNRNN
ncbi:transcriptional activator [Streptococcus pneumoniae]|nr:transcriptional activator [Streptococcus pneumoniae]